LRGFIVNTIVTAIAFYVLTRFLPDYVSYSGDTIGLVVLAVIFGLVNGLVGPIVKTLAMPLSLMTMGLIGFAVNAGLLLLTGIIANSTGFDLTIGDFPPDLATIDTIVAAVVGAVVLSVVSSAVRLVVPD
jgi:putative membrane protein